MSINSQICITISNFANILCVHQRTLRIWDKEGILTPSRTNKNRRYYTTEDIEKGKLILFLTRNLFLNLSGVKMILGLLKYNDIVYKDSISYLNKIAISVNIDTNIQYNNINKNSKRGRKIKIAKNP